MYDTSINYDLAAAEPIQEHRIRGTILSGDGISFDDSNIIEGSFQITNQCTDNNALVFGSCYIGQLTCEFTGLEYSVENPGGIEFSNWIGLEMTPYFGIYSAGLNIWNEIPLGKFTIKEAVHTENGVQITAYDHMTLFDVEIPEDNYNYLVSQKKDNLYYFANYACTQCGVTLGMTKAVFDELPNATSNTENIQIYGDYNGGEVEFHNDIGTYRDLLY